MNDSIVLRADHFLLFSECTLDLYALIILWLSVVVDVAVVVAGKMP